MTYQQQPYRPPQDPNMRSAKTGVWVLVWFFVIIPVGLVVLCCVGSMLTGAGMSLFGQLTD